MAGISRLQIDAATITPPAKPVSARCTLRLSSFFIKNTHAEPSTVPRNGISSPSDTVSHIRFSSLDAAEHALGPDRRNAYLGIQVL